MRQPTAAFSYYGGKQRLASKIVPLLPPHTVYVETHAGGLAVLFAKGRPRVSNTHDYREVVNDHDQRIVNFYRVLRDPVQVAELERRLALTPYSRVEYTTAAHLLRAGHGTPLDQAWAWYVNIQQSFGNKLLSGWGRSIFGRNQAQVWHVQVSRFPEVVTRLAEVHIDCMDQLAILDRWDSPQTCFYVDPPYPGADQGHYAGYTQADFEALLGKLATISGSFVLSSYDNPAFGQYPEWERYAFSAHASSSAQGQTGPNRDKTRAATQEERGDRTRTELVFVVDRSAQMRSFCQEAVRYQGQMQLFEGNL